jgi:hypothetical protein
VLTHSTSNELSQKVTQLITEQSQTNEIRKDSSPPNEFHIKKSHPAKKSSSTMGPQQSATICKRLRIIKRSQHHYVRQQMRLDSINTIEGRNYDNYKFPYGAYDLSRDHDMDKQRSRKARSKQKSQDRQIKITA